MHLNLSKIYRRARSTWERVCGVWYMRAQAARASRRNGGRSTAVSPPSKNVAKQRDPSSS